MHSGLGEGLGVRGLVYGAAVEPDKHSKDHICWSDLNLTSSKPPPVILEREAVCEEEPGHSLQAVSGEGASLTDLRSSSVGWSSRPTSLGSWRRLKVICTY